MKVDKRQAEAIANKVIESINNKAEEYNKKIKNSKEYKEFDNTIKETKEFIKINDYITFLRSVNIVSDYDVRNWEERYITSKKDKSFKLKSTINTNSYSSNNSTKNKVLDEIYLLSIDSPDIDSLMEKLVKIFE